MGPDSRHPKRPASALPPPTHTRNTSQEWLESVAVETHTASFDEEESKRAELGVPEFAAELPQTVLRSKARVLP